MTDNELAHATAGVHPLLVGVAKVNSFPDACVDDFIDSLGEPEPEMIEGRVSGLCATIVTPGLSPNSEMRIWAMAPLISLWADGYSGKGGVA